MPTIRSDLCGFDRAPDRARHRRPAERRRLFWSQLHANNVRNMAMMITVADERSIPCVLDTEPSQQAVMLEISRPESYPSSAAPSARRRPHALPSIDLSQAFV